MCHHLLLKPLLLFPALLNHLFVASAFRHRTLDAGGGGAPGAPDDSHETKTTRAENESEPSKAWFRNFHKQVKYEKAIVGTC